MSPRERIAALILDAWKRQGWQVRPEDAEAGIRLLTAPPRYNEGGVITFPGGRVCDFDKRVAAVHQLVEWRSEQPTDDEADTTYRMGLYRALSFLGEQERAELGRKLMEAAQ